MANILVADDESSARALISALLPHAGHQVREAANGAEALGLCLQDPPDLLISDALMPRMDGYELVRQLRKNPRTAQVRVIFYTAAFLEGEVRRLAAGCGVDRVMIKPTEPRALLAVVDEALAEGAPPVPVMQDEDFHQEHLQVLNHKLLALVRDLEAAGLERRRLLAYLVKIQEDERRTIAADIHDDAIQGMAAAAMRLEILERRLAGTDLVEIVSPVIEAVRGSIERLRRLMFQLRPPVLDSGGLAAALEAFMDRHSKDAGYTFSVTNRLAADPPDELRVLLYRVAQEALVNVGKHAQAQHVDVDLGPWGQGVAMRIRDDGVGFSVEQRARAAPGHLGIDSMRERVEMANGRWRLQSQPGHGTTVECWLPPSSSSSQPSVGAA